MPKKAKTGKRGFSAADKAEAMRLIYEEKWTAKDVALHFNCSANAVQNWKTQHKKAKPAVFEEFEKDEYDAEQDMVPVKTVKPVPHVSFDAFVRAYWKERAVDVLLMEHAVSAEVTKYVNEALRYAYDRFYK
ncbi:MAG: transposase [Planctomycetaceae bacterium]|nr:transposase [Planctomycetaceae bacterium]